MKELQRGFRNILFNSHGDLAIGFQLAFHSVKFLNLNLSINSTLEICIMHIIIMLKIQKSICNIDMKCELQSFGENTYA